VKIAAMNIDTRCGRITLRDFHNAAASSPNLQRKSLRLYI